MDKPTLSGIEKEDQSYIVFEQQPAVDSKRLLTHSSDKIRKGLKKLGMLDGKTYRFITGGTDLVKLSLVCKKAPYRWIYKLVKVNVKEIKG